MGKRRAIVPCPMCVPHLLVLGAHRYGYIFEPLASSEAMGCGRRCESLCWMLVYLQINPGRHRVMTQQAVGAGRQIDCWGTLLVPVPGWRLTIPWQWKHSSALRCPEGVAMVGCEDISVAGSHGSKLVPSRCGKWRPCYCGSFFCHWRDVWRHGVNLAPIEPFGLVQSMR